MDIAANLSGKYTLADVFKQLFHQVRVAAAATAVIRSAQFFKRGTSKNLPDPGHDPFLFLVQIFERRDLGVFPGFAHDAG
jgi:hypothetical protein